MSFFNKITTVCYLFILFLSSCCITGKNNNTSLKTGNGIDYLIQLDDSLFAFDYSFKRPAFSDEQGVMFLFDPIDELNKQFFDELNLPDNKRLLPDGNYVLYYDSFAVHNQTDTLRFCHFKIKNYKLNGLSVSFHPSGDTLSKGLYRDSKRTGEWVFTFLRNKNFFHSKESFLKRNYNLESCLNTIEKTSSNGFIFNEHKVFAEFKNGVPHGPFRLYGDKNLLVETEVKNFQLSKYYRQYYENGQLMRRFDLLDTPNPNHILYRNGGININNLMTSSIQKERRGDFYMIHHYFPGISLFFNTYPDCLTCKNRRQLRNYNLSSNNNQLNFNSNLILEPNQVLCLENLSQLIDGKFEFYFKDGNEVFKTEFKNGEIISGDSINIAMIHRSDNDNKKISDSVLSLIKKENLKGWDYDYDDYSSLKLIKSIRFDFVQQNEFIYNDSIVVDNNTQKYNFCNAVKSSNKLIERIVFEGDTVNTLIGFRALVAGIKGVKADYVITLNDESEWYDMYEKCYDSLTLDINLFKRDTSILELKTRADSVYALNGIYPYSRALTFGTYLPYNECVNEIEDGKYILFYEDTSNPLSIKNSRNMLRSKRKFAELNFKNHKLHGKTVFFYPTGDTMMKGVYDKGVKTGVWYYKIIDLKLNHVYEHEYQYSCYSEFNEAEIFLEYSNGIPKGKFTYKLNDVLILETKIKNGYINDYYREYYESGKLKRSFNLLPDTSENSIVYIQPMKRMSEGVLTGIPPIWIMCLGMYNELYDNNCEFTFEESMSNKSSFNEIVKRSLLHGEFINYSRISGLPSEIYEFENGVVKNIKKYDYEDGTLYYEFDGKE